MIDGVTGVVLTGGLSRRFGSNKALVDWDGGKLIEAAVGVSKSLFFETLIPTKEPERYGFLESGGVRLLHDVSKRQHPGVGLLSALYASPTDRVFVLACDMPRVRPALVRGLCASAWGYEAVVPVWKGRMQPLCAVYSRACIGPLEALLDSENFSLMDLLGKVKARRVDDDELAAFDPQGASFADIDTAEDLVHAH